MVCNGIKLEPVLYTKQIEDENIAQTSKRYRASLGVKSNK